MQNKKSDFKRFCETMWIMTKYDVLPWVVGAGIVAAVTFGVIDNKKKGTWSQKTDFSTVFQKQR